MDMDFKGKRPRPLHTTSTSKELPGFRASSELPEHGVEETDSDPIVSAFDVAPKTDAVFPSSTDPTDLTLDRDKPKDSEQSRPFEKPMKPKRKSTKKQIIVLLALLLLVAGAAVGWYFWQKHQDALDKSGQSDVVADEQATKSAEPELVASPLTGLSVSPEQAKKQITAVMIENSVDARPQSGLYESDMVFEAVAEGGITRFVALYQDSTPTSIGPIRSARPYYVEIAKTFDAAFVHAGGSPDGLAKITELGVKDMSAFESNGTYTRVDTKAAPHNLYSSIQALNERQSVLGYSDSTVTPWKRKNDTPQTPTVSSFDFSISGVLYNPSFTYDATTNSYLRSQNGDAHLDENATKQINPKVVLAIITSKGQDGLYSTYRLTGNGEIRVFQDGIVSEGTWSKESSSSQFVFRDKNGLEFNFNKGQVWVSLLGSAGNITTAP